MYAHVSKKASEATARAEPGFSAACGFHLRRRRVAPASRFLSAPRAPVSIHKHPLSERTLSGYASRDEWLRYSPKCLAGRSARKLEGTGRALPCLGVNPSAQVPGQRATARERASERASRGTRWPHSLRNHSARTTGPAPLLRERASTHPRRPGHLLTLGKASAAPSLLGQRHGPQAGATAPRASFIFRFSAVLNRP